MNATATPLQPLESLADDLLSSYKAISGHACRFLVLLREFDLRRGYREARSRGRSADDSAEWLHARFGMARESIREDLRIAYALLNLPETESAFEAGELSPGKVRALVGVATFANEGALLQVARGMTDAQFADHCQRLGRTERRFERP